MHQFVSEITAIGGESSVSFVHSIFMPYKMAKVMSRFVSFLNISFFVTQGALLHLLVHALLNRVLNRSSEIS